MAVFGNGRTRGTPQQQRQAVNPALPQDHPDSPSPLRSLHGELDDTKDGPVENTLGQDCMDLPGSSMKFPDLLAPRRGRLAAIGASPRREGS